MTVIVKHSYISAKWHLNKKGATTWKSAKVAAVNKAVGHVDYIQHRPGIDRDKHGRQFFDAEEDQIDGKDVRELVREEGNDRNIVAHKLMLSPDIKVQDLKQFTREVIKELANENGLDLNWKAVEHRNTDHHHVHILLMAKDRNGREVRLTKQDHDKIEKTADHILDRDYPWQRQQVRLEREQRQREHRQQEAQQQLENFRFRELPWMKQKVIKEQYEPYTEWEKDADQRQQRRKEFAEQPITIAEKEFSKTSSLKELYGAEKLLRRRGGEHLSDADYKKFRSWITDKELEAIGQKAHPDPDKFEFHGKIFTKDTQIGELRAVRKFLLETQKDPNPNNPMRLHSEDKAKLKEWLDDKHRAEGVDSPEKSMKQALTRQSNEEKQYADAAEIFTQQEAMSKNPVLALFTNLLATGDPRERIAQDQREQLRDTDRQITDSLKNNEKTAKSDNSTTPEREQSIKRQKHAKFTIGRYMSKQIAEEQERKRKEIQMADEQNLDNDFPGE
jgi:hypothetical protein